MEQAGIVRRDADSPEARGVALSRRSFIGVAVGAFAALRVVPGGLALPFETEKAYAADATVVVAKIDEVAVVVMDMADKKRTPVEGARVVLKSCFNGKTVEGKTSNKGTIVFNIAGLAEDAGKKKKPAKYEFDAEIEVTKDGYRIFRTGRTHVEGARGLAAPTRKLEQGVPYPSRVTFDDWDVLYTDNEFCVTAKNDMRHTMRIDLNNVSGSGTVKASLYADDKQIASGTATPNNGACTVELLEHFLLKTGKKVLPVNANFSIRYEQNGQEYRAPISLKVCAAQGGFEAPGVDRNFSLSPFSEGKSGHKGLQISFPNGIPIIGGQTLPLWKPEFSNMDYGFDPFGYAYISVRTTDWGYKSKDGKVQGDGWQFHPRKTISEQIEKVWEDAGNNTIDTLSAIDKRTGKFTHVKLMRQFSATVGAQLSLVAKWGEKEDGLVRLRFGGQIILAIDFSLAWQFLAGPVPLLFEFGLNSSAAVGVNIAASTPKLTDFDQWKIDYTNSSISLTIDISPSISLGVGIKGALSISVKGVFTLTFFIAKSFLPDNRPKDIENPHVVVGIGYSTQVVIQFLFFTIPYKLPFKMNEPQYYDSWKGGYKKDYTTKGMTAQSEEPQSFLSVVQEALASGEAHQLTEDEFEELAEEEWLGFNYENYSQPDNMQFTPEKWDITGSDGNKIDVQFYGEGTSSGTQGQSVSDGPGDLTAGSSPALTPQSTTQDIGTAAISTASIPPATRDIRLYFTNQDQVVKAGIKRAGRRTGLVPNAVDIFTRKSFGDPHMQLRMIFGRQFIFRIAVLGIDSTSAEVGVFTDKWGMRSPVYRSRIMFEGSFDDKERNVFVIDFNHPWAHPSTPSGGMQWFNRDDYDDYDFDVLVEENGDKATLHFFIISGYRGAIAGAESSGVSYLGKDQLLCYVVFEVDKRAKTCERKTDMCFKADTQVGDKYVLDAADGKSEFPFHHYSCPQVTLLKDEVSGKTQTGLMFSYLDRAAATQMNILSQKEGEVREGVGLFYYTFANGGRMTFTDADEINNAAFDELKDYSIYQMTVLPRCKTNQGKGTGWYIVMLRGISTYYFLIEAGAMAAKQGNKYYAAGCREPLFFAVFDGTAKEPSNVLDSWSAPAQLIPWPNPEGSGSGYAGYLASYKGKLMNVKLTVPDNPSNDAKPFFTFEEIGPQNFNITSFGVANDGRFLFYPAVREGVPAYRYDANGEGSAKKEVEEHYVMACRLRNGKFSDPFVFCEVDYDMDTLVACGTQKSVAMSFVSTNIIDTKTSKAEMRYTAMPYVRCANVIGFSVVGEYAFPGVACPFNLTIRNDGNVYLSGCSIRLHKRGAKNDKTDTLTKIVFSKDTLVESNYNMKKSDGTLEDVEPDYSLAPGKTSVYSVMLMVPKDWAGKVKVSATAQDFVAAGQANTKPVKGMVAVTADSNSALDDEELVTQGADTEVVDDTDYDADEGDIDFEGGYEDIDYDEYEDDVDYIDYADYEEPGEETDEDGNVYVDYIVDDSDYEDDDLLEYPYDDIEILYSEEVPGEELDDAPVTGTRPIAKASSGIPKMGDSATGAELALMAAAGASAVMAAYSKRRVDNERAAAAEAAGEKPSGKEGHDDA